MTINVLFFADLKEKLNTASIQIDDQSVVTVKDAWQCASNNHPLPANLLCARNQEMCALYDTLNPGDEVAFFPPVSGG